MTLKTQITADLSVFYNPDEFATSATYTPAGGSASSVYVVLDSIDPTLMDDAPPDDSMLLSVQYSDVSDPKRGDMFVVGSDTYYVVQILGGDYQVEWNLLVSRSDRRLA